MGRLPIRFAVCDAMADSVDEIETSVTETFLSFEPYCGNSTMLNDGRGVSALVAQPLLAVRVLQSWLGR
jgi:hypothetical protein